MVTFGVNGEHLAGAYYGLPFPIQPDEDAEDQTITYYTDGWFSGWTGFWFADSWTATNHITIILSSSRFAYPFGPIDLTLNIDMARARTFHTRADNMLLNGAANMLTGIMVLNDATPGSSRSFTTNGAFEEDTNEFEVVDVGNN